MFDPTQLRTFLTVARTRSFTAAAGRLGLRQSTVSQHVRKLERVAGTTLLVRDTHSVELTGDGEAMTRFADTILRTGERAMDYFARSELRGRLRLGVSEDFVLTELPEILRDFRDRHPMVDLELSVEFSDRLHERLLAGELDVVFGKRRQGEQHGRLVWWEKLAWIGAPQTRVDIDAPVPLIVYPPPSITREQAFGALDGAGLDWRVSCVSGSLSGLRAAALAGLGVTVHARSLIPPGLVTLDANTGLPDPGEVEFMLLTGRDAAGTAAGELAEMLTSNTDRLHRP